MNPYCRIMNCLPLFLIVEITSCQSCINESTIIPGSNNTQKTTIEDIPHSDDFCDYFYSKDTLTDTLHFNFDDKYTLNEKMVDDFVSWQKETNTASKIQYFESNVDTYRAFGPYWLTLAEAYYTHGDYEKCLDALTEYENLEIQIFRKDYDYAQVLPLGMVGSDMWFRLLSYCICGIRLYS